MKKNESEGGCVLGALCGAQEGQWSFHSRGDLCSHQDKSDWESRLCDEEKGKVEPFINS